MKCILCQAVFTERVEEPDYCLNCVKKRADKFDNDFPRLTTNTVETSKPIEIMFIDRPEKGKIHENS